VHAEVTCPVGQHERLETRFQYNKHPCKVSLNQVRLIVGPGRHVHLWNMRQEAHFSKGRPRLLRAIQVAAARSIDRRLSARPRTSSEEKDGKHPTKGNTEQDAEEEQGQKVVGQNADTVLRQA